jgi:predicted nucleotidyltransferase
VLDLQPRHLHIVVGILAACLPGREVRAFGSRTNGTAGRFSDLDLLVLSDEPLDFAVLGRVRDAFSESDLPFRVDIVDSASMRGDWRETILPASVVVQTGFDP